MRKLYLAVMISLLAVLASGCASEEVRRERELRREQERQRELMQKQQARKAELDEFRAKCAEYGFSDGTPEMALCVQKVEEKIEADKKEHEKEDAFRRQCGPSLFRSVLEPTIDCGRRF